jgi:hypothetical protein
MIRTYAVSAVLLAASCAAPRDDVLELRPDVEHSDILSLGDSFESSIGGLRMIAVQDEFHLVRCTEGGTIAGCFDWIFTLQRDEVRFNRWIHVPAAPGLDVALVTPTKVVFQIRRESSAR